VPAHIRIAGLLGVAAQNRTKDPRETEPTTSTGMSKLTIKQERFAQKYVELGNASEAYRLSYDAENMAPETVNNETHVLLKNREISARIEHLEEL
jgi:phage terminase small subunit